MAEVETQTISTNEFYRNLELENQRYEREINVLKDKLKRIRKDRKDEKRFSGDIEKPLSKRSE